MLLLFRRGRQGNIETAVVSEHAGRRAGTRRGCLLGRHVPAATVCIGPLNEQLCLACDPSGTVNLGV